VRAARRPVAPRACAWPRHRGQHGLFRTCCLGLLILVALCAGAIVLLVRLTASPAFLATAPLGADDGPTIQAIATKLATQLSLALLDKSGQATVLVSDRDLTVIAAEENPDPQTLSGVEVRSNPGHLLVSAHSRLGPLPVVVTAQLTPRLVNGYPQIDLGDIQVGDQGIPGFMRSLIYPQGKAIFDFGPLIRRMSISTFGLECLVVVPDGVELGFHSPFSGAQPAVCATAAN
jgi:hypothetical protein